VEFFRIFIPLIYEQVDFQDLLNAVFAAQQDPHLVSYGSSYFRLN